jgi:SAM-dependent methyltransferase
MAEFEKDHWTRVYSDKAPTTVSWFQEEPAPSLRALDTHGGDPLMSLIDIGGGASNLVDALLERGWSDLTVLDLSATALDAARLRLGPWARKVHWETADITEWQPARQYDVWHDRAAFHFLTQPEQRDRYREALMRSLADQGLAIFATFALDGPERCSGLEVERYDAEKLTAELGPSLRLIDAWNEVHATPWGSSQSFNWCVLRRSETQADG